VYRVFRAARRTTREGCIVNIEREKERERERERERESEYVNV